MKTHMNRRGFLRATFGTAFAALANAQDMSQPLRPLPTGRELQHLHWLPPDEGTKQEVAEILGELRSRIRDVVPGAQHIPSHAIVYIKEEEAPNIRPYFYTSNQATGGDNVAMALVITTGALKALSERPLLKAAIGHELAHPVLEMNPDVRDDPRFQPKSDAFANELKNTQFVALNEDWAWDKRPPYAEFKPGNPQEIKEAASIIDTKKQHYIEELQADKLGIWLSRDAGAAIKMQHIIAGYHTPGHQYALGEERIPHASRDVRCAEIQASYDEMKAREKDDRAFLRRPRPFTRREDERFRASSQTTRRG